MWSYLHRTQPKVDTGKSKLLKFCSLLPRDWVSEKIGKIVAIYSNCFWKGLNGKKGTLEKCIIFLVGYNLWKLIWFFKTISDIIFIPLLYFSLQLVLNEALEQFLLYQFRYCFEHHRFALISLFLCNNLCPPPEVLHLSDFTVYKFNHHESDLR